MSKAMLTRRVEEETLDHLREDDPRAIRSRRDLRRINRVMGSASIVDSLLRGSLKRPPKRIAELGAGDGSLLLVIARRRATEWPGVALTLVDRLNIVDATARAAFADLGWTANAAVMDVFDWLEHESDRQYDAVVANLFVHHFEGHGLRRLLGAIARVTECFVACEPRRAQVAQVGSYLVGALGVNDVTRRDAVLSVRAGFRDHEISACWPDDGQWQLREGDARLFSHTFTAVRRKRRD